MNRTFRFFLAAALSLSLFAPASASAGTGDDVIRGPYEPTRFGDNTFIDVQGGVNAFGASNMTRCDVWSSVRPSAALGVSLGKWFVPSDSFSSAVSLATYFLAWRILLSGA